MSKLARVRIVIAGLILALGVGCGFKKGKDDGAALQQGQQVSASMENLQIVPSDWIIETATQNRADILTKTVKAEKMELIRKNFRVPRLTALTVPESNGFELYEVRGYQELETKAYLLPKVYINSGTSQGSILGYRTGTKDPTGHDLIEISVPIALVNGLVPSLPTVGGPQSGPGAAVSLPPKYRIDQIDELKARVGREVATLPVCPKLFRLAFEGREYWAKSPFDRLSNCPLNQFFRITFQAPVEEMRHLLETAAIRDEAVMLLTNLSVNFDLPKKVVELSFSPQDFHAALLSALSKVPSSAVDLGKGVGYATQDLEAAVIEALFVLAKNAGFEAQYSASLLSAVNPLIANYFSLPFACGAGMSCRTPLRHSTQRTAVRFSWMETEDLAAGIETETATGLSAVANTSEFVAKPARDQLNLLRRPSYFKAREFGDVIKECTELAATGFPFNPETTDDGKKYFESYCRAVAANAALDLGDSNQWDGYYPLGSNTVVYPGAWLKIDIDDISEFTTAKTRSTKDGRVLVESDVVDILAQDPAAHRTQCVSGSSIACEEYETKRIQVRDTSGAPMYSSKLCKKGEDGCECVLSANTDGTPGEELCSKKQYLFQDVLAYDIKDCAPKDLSEPFCPYWRLDEECTPDEVEHQCETVKVTGHTSFLCLSGCDEHTEIHCAEKARKPCPGKIKKLKLNCQIDDPAGTMLREQTCRAPKYKCKRWSQACTRYTVNETFHVVHEEVAPKWRPFSIQQGEYPKRFEEDLYLKFVSPGRTVSNCKLSRFAREFRGNTLYIKMPSETNSGLQPCDVPLWDDSNSRDLYLPKVYLKNAISYSERRLCGRTEYSFTTKEVPISMGDGLVPPEFSFKTESHIGPIAASCRAEHPVLIGSDLWFTEAPPIRFSGRVSVLGRVLESIVTEQKK
jgi:hypothetical protein